MFDFSTPVDRHGTWCTQWDYVADRFGAADLLPFTISDMDFATAPCITDALHQRINHGVFGYSRWKNDEFLAAVAHWFRQRFNSRINTDTVDVNPFITDLLQPGPDSLFQTVHIPGIETVDAFQAIGKAVNLS